MASVISNFYANVVPVPPAPSIPIAFAFGATTPDYEVNGPHGIYHAGTNKTWFAFEGWTGSARCPRVVVLDHGSNTWSQIYRTVAHDLFNDAHGNPTMIRDSFGFWHLFYGIHLDETNEICYHASTLRADDPSVWMPQFGLAPATEIFCPVLVGSDIWLLYRDWPGGVNDYAVGIQKLTINSQGFATQGAQIKIIDAGVSGRVYWHPPFNRNGTEIHFIATRTDFSVSTANNIYYFVYDTTTGNIKTFDGSHTTLAASLPVTAANCDTFYEIFATTGIQAMGLAYDTGGNTHVLYTNINGSSTYDVIAAANFGTGWLSGGTLGQTPAGFASGMLCLTALSGGGVAAYWNDNLNAPVSPVPASVWSSQRASGSGGAWTTKAKILSISSGATAVGNYFPVFNGTASAQVVFQQQIADTDTTPGIGSMQSWLYGQAGFQGNADPQLAANTIICLSPFSNSGTAADIAFTNGSLTATCGTTNLGGNNAAANVGVLLGQTCYWEARCNNDSAPGAGGVAVGATWVSATRYLGRSSKGIALYDDGSVVINDITVATLSAFTSGDVIGCYLTNGSAGSFISFRKNGGNWNNNVANDPTVGSFSITNGVHEWLPAVEIERATDSITIRLASSSWGFAAPTGAVAVGANV